MTSTPYHRSHLQQLFNAKRLCPMTHALNFNIVFSSYTLIRIFSLTISSTPPCTKLSFHYATATFNTKVIFSLDVMKLITPLKVTPHLTFITKVAVISLVLIFCTSAFSQLRLTATTTITLPRNGWLPSWSHPLQNICHFHKSHSCLRVKHMVCTNCQPTLSLSKAPLFRQHYFGIYSLNKACPVENISTVGRNLLVLYAQPQQPLSCSA